MIFPPIFAYALFGFLWIIELVLNLTLIGAPAAEVVAIFGEVLLFLWLFDKYGFDTFKRFSDAKNGKKFKKRFFTQLIGDLIPFVNMFPWNLWFIYKEYKSELEESKKRESGELDEEESGEKKGLDLKKAALLGAAAIATGGAAAGALAGEAAVAGEATAVAEGGALATGGEAASVGRGARLAEGNFGSGMGRKMIKRGNVKTIEEEVGGVKTGMNREDYDSGISDYSRMDTYEKNNDIQKILAKAKRGERLSEAEGNKYNSYQINGAYDRMDDRNYRGNGSVSGGRVGREVSRNIDPDMQRILEKAKRGEELTEVEGNKYNSYQINRTHDEIDERNRR